MTNEPMNQLPPKQLKKPNNQPTHPLLKYENDHHPQHSHRFNPNPSL